MFGQFLVEPDGFEPVELPDGVVPVEPEDPFVDELPDDVPDEVLPELVLPEPVLDVVPVVPVLVAALATSAPPATRPVVKAPTASALRSRSFMVMFLLTDCSHAPPT